MRPIHWLHLSDLHMRERDSWSQDIVLKAMHDHIYKDFSEGIKADFILVTGDLTFSGRATEYRLVEEFFDALSIASRVTKESIYCIPGNHDIDRDRNKLCFEGARKVLQNMSAVDSLLEGQDDLETLATRQENYRRFQEAYFSEQKRIGTEDQLGYVSRITLDDVHIAIVGLNSAWLAEGGLADHGKLLIGERQVINAINLIKKHDQRPHIIIGMAHHPLHLLCEFDRRPVQNRIEEFCHFFHFGHLHQSETRTSGFSGSGCLTLGAGASFETRQSHNSYSVVTLDLLQALRTVMTIKFDPNNSMFSSTASEEYRIEVNPQDIYGVDELAGTMKGYCTSLGQWPHYLSALLLGQKSEVLICTSDDYAFGSLAVSQAPPVSDLQEKTNSFMAFKNVLCVLHKDIPLADIFTRYGDMVREYGVVLEQISNAQPNIKARLLEYEDDARKLVNANRLEFFSYTFSLLDNLAYTKDWGLLREQAQRHISSYNSKLAAHAKRMLALSLANSYEEEDKNNAIKLYQSLIESGVVEFTDVGNFSTLLMNVGRLEEAKTVTLRGIEQFPVEHIRYFTDIGRKIVEESGDRVFRDALETIIKEKKL